MKQIAIMLCLIMLAFTACTSIDAQSDSSSLVSVNSVVSDSVDIIPEDARSLAERLEDAMEKEDIAIDERKAELEESGLMP